MGVVPGVKGVNTWGEVDEVGAYEGLVLEDLESESEDYKLSMGDLFGQLSAEDLGEVLLFLESRELLVWREVSKARHRVFASATHAVKHGQRLLLDLHHSGLQLQALARVASDERRDSNFSSCPISNSKYRKLPTPGSVWSVAHRGCSATHEGNSLPAFVEAVRVGADMIELDVALCKTGEVVVHHNLYDEGSGLSLRHIGLDDIRTAHPHLVTIGTVLHCPALRDSSIHVYFDLKGCCIARPLMNEIHQAILHGGWEPSRLLVASFNQFDLLEVNACIKAYPELEGVSTAVIIDSVPLTLARDAEEVGASWISVGKHNCTPNFVRDAKERGLGVMAWTVNNCGEMEDLMRSGVDAIVTDHPEKVAPSHAKVASEADSPICPEHLSGYSSWDDKSRRVRDGGVCVNDDTSLEFPSGKAASTRKAIAPNTIPDPACRTGIKDHSGGKVCGLEQLFAALYRSLTKPRHALAWASAEANAMCSLCVRVPSVGAFVSSSPQGDRLMKQLAPTVSKAEALAVEILNPSILSKTAQEVAETVLRRFGGEKGEQATLVQDNLPLQYDGAVKQDEMLQDVSSVCRGQREEGSASSYCTSTESFDTEIIHGSVSSQSMLMLSCMDSSAPFTPLVCDDLGEAEKPKENSGLNCIDISLTGRGCGVRGMEHELFAFERRWLKQVALTHDTLLQNVP